MKKILILLILLIPFSVFASETENIKQVVSENTSLASNAKSAILIDAKSGEILYEKNSHEKLAPASMTKMMSMLLVIEAIEKGSIKWDDIITISENASGMGGSQILLETNEKMSVKDLFKGVAIASGNDAIVALAEATYGTTDEFVKAMNEKANSLGLTDSNFKNVHGLDEENHYSSAYDMALIAKELVRHKKVLEFTKIYEDYLRKGTDKELWLVNTNKLVRFYDGVDGLKTGYTPEAGYCLTATINKNDMRLISVIMGEPSSKVRNKETTDLINYGFSKYKSIPIIEKNKVVTEVKMMEAEDINVSIVPKEDVSLLIKKTDKIGKINYEVKLNNISIKTKKGDTIGKLIIKENNKIIKKVDLTINKKIKKANILTLYKRYLSNIISGNISFNK